MALGTCWSSAKHGAEPEALESTPVMDLTDDASPPALGRVPQPEIGMPYGLPHLSKTDPELQPPQFVMCRAIKTVESLWCEWTVGLPGRPGNAYLDRKWGSRWRARRGELQWFLDAATGYEGDPARRAEAAKNRFFRKVSRPAKGARDGGGGAT
ncbi:hypothetical protein N657DRAFT_636005 [Parathielavia appendiculata]|uniref:Transcription activator GCR1-like domain-containing protein n=1 Tax=Parathielavia appendiculata TaxID=2587402 RepID=A0AAN6Z0X6_9PEZI|nr:hypothetical protein N657DRAFT_636005 [Parathielavia appendiculata]